MTADEILAEWERRHGELSPEQRSRFLTKGGHVGRLSKLPGSVVRDGILRYQHLNEIEAFATNSGGRRGAAAAHRRPGLDSHPSEWGRVTMRQPGQPEHVMDQGYCETCGIRLTPEGRCSCS